MKRRRIILWILFLFYCTAAAFCLLSTGPSPFGPFPKAAPTGSSDVPPAESFPETAAETETPEVNGTADETDRPEVTQKSDTMQRPEEGTSVPGSEADFTPVSFLCRTHSLPLNVRDTPSMDGRVIARISSGEEGMITDIVDEEWVRVLYHDTDGYCARRYLEYALPSDEGPADNAGQEQNGDTGSGSGPETASETVESDMVSILQGCYVRKEPDHRNPEVIIRVAEAGSSYPHVPEKDTSNFYAIQLPDRTIAYVSVDYSTAGPEETEKDP